MNTNCSMMNDTDSLQGTHAKAKVNTAQGRYTTRFALPIYGEDGEIDRYNVFRIEVLIRQEEDGRKYLYDLVNIKKETSTPLES